MRTAIIVIIVIQLIADVVASLALLGQNFLLAILGLALALLSLVPLIALLRCMEDVSDLQSEVYSLRNRLHRLEGRSQLRRTDRWRVHLFQKRRKVR